MHHAFSSFRRVQPALWLSLIAIAFLLVESVARIGLYLVSRYPPYSEYQPLLSAELSSKHRDIITRLMRDETQYTTYSASLGWTIRPNGTAPLYRSNSQGLRAVTEFAATSRNGVLRVATFGDSFTHGDDVENDDTWQEVMNRSEPRLEVMNFGVPGFGLDQAFLRYEQDGIPYRPRIVLIGFLSGDIERHVNVFRPFLGYDTGYPLTKPSFLTHGDRLVLHENPFHRLACYGELLSSPSVVLPKLGRHDYFYARNYKKGPFDGLAVVRLLKMAFFELRQGQGDPYRDGVYQTTSPAFNITVRLFDAFVAKALRNNSLPIIVVFPGRRDVRTYEQGGPVSYEPLIRQLEKERYLFIDLLDTVTRPLDDRFTVRDLFVSTHFSPRGNAIVANGILEYLNRRRVFDEGSVDALIQELKESVVSSERPIDEYTIANRETDAICGNATENATD